VTAKDGVGTPKLFTGAVCGRGKPDGWHHEYRRAIQPSCLSKGIQRRDGSACIGDYGTKASSAWWACIPYLPITISALTAQTWLGVRVLGVRVLGKRASGTWGYLARVAEG
jgi:hypothetical protein